VFRVTRGLASNVVLPECKPFCFAKIARLPLPYISVLFVRAVKEADHVFAISSHCIHLLFLIAFLGDMYLVYLD